MHPQSQPQPQPQPQPLDAQGQARTLPVHIPSSRAAQGSRVGQGVPHGDSVCDLIEAGRS